MPARPWNLAAVPTPLLVPESVQLPARWNLCKAQAPADVQALKPRDRVQATGTVTAPRTDITATTTDTARGR